MAWLPPTAVSSRRRAFAAGRTAAHRALAGLGVDTGAIGIGSGGAPVWPEGIVGSITHSAGWALAVAGFATDFAGIGVDMEGNRPFPGLVEQVATPAEREWLADQPESSAIALFAAKESIYKAFYPRINEFFGFNDVELVSGGEGFVGSFTRTIDPAYPPGRPIEVDYQWYGSIVVALTTLPPR